MNIVYAVMQKGCSKTSLNTVRFYMILLILCSMGVRHLSKREIHHRNNEKGAGMETVLSQA
ncbi:hypothetical protein ABE29_04855 [Cytobacillus firmus]|uniref:hypothetical protein n=1 Tax=Cytobacillus firmus TaxID=1399 RepID=UPI00077C4027|nr:hypothetical protein [Cytobacillus firmus]MBG9542171.1 hypothetical protein [Cytobacillus firmus]MBG9557612.1 hypothetical protein [Cytobacillus firmus]MED4767254.1 hypothetical protein [Cytobacillus firmus]NUH84341.1 hypothetical protein [Cytobacillus firmus]